MIARLVKLNIQRFVKGHMKEIIECFHLGSMFLDKKWVKWCPEERLSIATNSMRNYLESEACGSVGAIWMFLHNGLALIREVHLFAIGQGEAIGSRLTQIQKEGTWEFWSSIWPNEAKKVKKDRDKAKKDREKKRKEAKRKYIQKREELARKKPKKESRPSDVIPDEAESMDLESPDLQYGIVDKSFEEEKKEDDDQEEDLSDKSENLWDIDTFNEQQAHEMIEAFGLAGKDDVGMVEKLKFVCEEDVEAKKNVEFLKGFLENDTRFSRQTQRVIKLIRENL